MTDLLVQPMGRGLIGSVPVPPDKSIAHRALLLAAIATGVSRIRGASFGADNRATLAAVRALGVRVEERDKSELRVSGVGLDGLRAPESLIDCGNSGTTMRLVAGLLAGQRFHATLVGDASLSSRPMMRVVRPLRARGARIEGTAHAARPGELTAPLRIGPIDRERLAPLEHESPIASAQVKSALLLSGLRAEGRTLFKEPYVSRDHTERMLRTLGAPIETVASCVALDPSGWDGRLAPVDLDIPGDPSAAAFLLVAAQIVPGSRVSVRDVGLNATRTGLLEIAREMGSSFAVEVHDERGGEPVGAIHAAHGDLLATRAGGERIGRAIDEVCIACALAARAVGVSRFEGAAELRVKESDRLAMMARTLRAFGVECEELADGLVIQGRRAPLEPADVDSGGDHRVAMTAVILGLVARGPSRVRDVDCIATSFPRFVGTLRALGADVAAD